MASIIKNSSKSAWNGMFQKAGHDIDRIVVSFLDVKDLNVLVSCKRWRNNACLISWKDRHVVEWRKDQAAPIHRLVVNVFRHHGISLWDVPHHLYNGDLTRGEEGMPKIDGKTCSIAQYRVGEDLGLVFALQSKKIGSVLTGPLLITRLGDQLQITSRTTEEIGVGGTLMMSVQLPPSRLGVVFRTVHNEPEAISWTDYRGYRDIVHALLSDKNPKFGLANRIMQVLPGDSPLIPASVPLIPTRPDTSHRTLLIRCLLFFLVLGVLADIFQIDLFPKLRSSQNL